MAAEPQGVEIWVDLEGGAGDGFLLQLPALAREIPAHARSSDACATERRARMSRAVEAEKNFRKALVAANMRRLRTDAGLTITEAAAKLGVDRRQLSHWEHCESEPRPHRLQALALLYGCEFGDFYVVEPPSNTGTGIAAA